MSVTGFSGTSALGATVNVDTDGGFDYDPTSSATIQNMPPGLTFVDTFVYTVSDGQGGSDFARANVRVKRELATIQASLANDTATAAAVPGAAVTPLQSDRIVVSGRPQASTSNGPAVDSLFSAPDSGPLDARPWTDPEGLDWSAGRVGRTIDQTDEELHLLLASELVRSPATADGGQRDRYFRDLR